MLIVISMLVLLARAAISTLDPRYVYYSGSSMTVIELDWEFNASHWFDFSQEDAGNPDAWFDEQAAKLADDSRISMSGHDTEQENSNNSTDPPYGNSHLRNTSRKLPTRITLSERWNRVHG
jgi:hypothetical protein